jgi:hypothetical protein
MFSKVIRPRTCAQIKKGGMKIILGTVLLLLINVGWSSATAFENLESHLYTLNDVKSTAAAKYTATEALHDHIELNHNYVSRGYTFEQRWQKFYPTLVQYCHSSSRAYADCLQQQGKFDVMEKVLIVGTLKLFTALVEEILGDYTSVPLPTTLTITSLHSLITGFVIPVKKELLTHYEADKMKTYARIDEMLSKPDNLYYLVLYSDQLMNELLYYQQLYDKWEASIGVWTNTLSALQRSRVVSMARTCVQKTAHIVNSLRDNPNGDYRTFNARYLSNTPSRTAVNAFLQSAMPLIKARQFTNVEGPLKRIIASVNYNNKYELVYFMNSLLTYVGVVEDGAVSVSNAHEHELTFATTLADRCLDDSTSMYFCAAVGLRVPVVYKYIMERHILIKYNKSLIPVLADLERKPLDISDLWRFNQRLIVIWKTLRQLFEFNSIDRFLDFWESQNWLPESASELDRFMMFMGYKRVPLLWDINPLTAYSSLHAPFDPQSYCLQDYWDQFLAVVMNNRAGWWRQIGEIADLYELITGVAQERTSLLTNYDLLQKSARAILDKNRAIAISPAVLSQFDVKGLMYNGRVKEVKQIFEALAAGLKKEEGWLKKLTRKSSARLQQAPDLPATKCADAIAVQMYAPAGSRRLTLFK